MASKPARRQRLAASPKAAMTSSMSSRVISSTGSSRAWLKPARGQGAGLRSRMTWCGGRRGPVGRPGRRRPGGPSPPARPGAPRVARRRCRSGPAGPGPGQHIKVAGHDEAHPALGQAHPQLAQAAGGHPVRIGHALPGGAAHQPLRNRRPPRAQGEKISLMLTIQDAGGEAMANQGCGILRSPGNLKKSGHGHRTHRRGRAALIFRAKP